LIVNTGRLKEIAEVEFGDVVEDVIITDINELRIIFFDGSFIDAWYSLKLKERYSYHWERKFIDGSIYRHDNAPHKKWENVSTFPKHFHNGSEDAVISSNIPDNPEEALKEFLTFVSEHIKKNLP
jgi:hypothetical protein